MSAEPMDAKTLEALKASIRKWRENANVREPDKAQTGSGDCPLCGIFFVRWCSGCPVAKTTGRTLCGGSPYHEATVARARWMDGGGSRAAWQAAARAEVAFLESLLPEGETA